MDIETAPNLAHVWQLWDQNVGLPQLINSAYMMCWSAKWEGHPTVMFGRVGQSNYLARLHKLLTEADVVVGFNHIQFDNKWIRTEFVKAGMTPPPKWIDIDLCRVAKTTFKFPSNKLAYLASVLLGDTKVTTGGHQLWIDCMAGDKQAWAKMREYNEHDVVLTEALYTSLKPWIKLPSPYLMGDTAEPHSCPGCGSVALQARGRAVTALTTYQRYQCKDCGRWSRGNTRVRAQGVR